MVNFTWKRSAQTRFYENELQKSYTVLFTHFTSQNVMRRLYIQLWAPKVHFSAIFLVNFIFCLKMHFSLKMRKMRKNALLAAQAANLAYAQRLEGSGGRLFAKISISQKSEFYKKHEM